ncbi:RIP metalloprotease RseP [Desulfonema magnum]|uniref:Zinc metalloprotease n=1 Tax=Desulfonema magnum TaxID=45655 RepID=A0A975GTE1_9BACT|nr:RIP metalloprotease RseP [Desulfonema magnum]QTA92996.1 Zinc metallopeptidase, M50 family [Desulfonema magnum]
MITTIFSFVVVLGILIFFHELGHFLAARACGVGVEKFSLGFGPRLFGKTAGITDYRISAIPLGGYVKMVGEEPDAKIDPADIPLSFTHKSVFRRMLIVAAGPVFNLFLAVIIFFGIFQVSGIPVSKALIGEVREGTPAYQAGLQKGDTILAIDEIKIDTWEDMSGIISESRGRELALSVQRGDSVFDVNIIPRLTTTKNIFGEDIERHVIGITSSHEVVFKDLNPFQALSASLVQTYDIAKLTIVSIVKMIQGKISAKENLGGPIMIAQMSGKIAKEGPGQLAFWIALLSVSLGVLNFLPIPVLDGGHLVFFFIELLIGHPVNTKMREIAQQVGIFVLILLMIFVFYNDIARVFFS